MDGTAVVSDGSARPLAPLLAVDLPAPWTKLSVAGQFVTAALVFGPLAALGWGIARSWNHGIGWLDVGLAVGLYILTGYGLTIGFHRLFTHRSFQSARWLKIVLAVAGSLAAEGSLIGWVALHRRHHACADKGGDPHSPMLVGGAQLTGLRGLVHAHVGWLFAREQADEQRWCPDLLTDTDLTRVSSLVPLWIPLTLAIPFFVGWIATQRIEGALLALLWAGAVRVALVHHMTWSVNSLGHTFGRRPYDTGDRSGNLAILSIVSFGDSWHNNHHASPALARHGTAPGQLDPSAALIRMFEHCGWATHVRWPNAARLAQRHPTT